MTKLQHITAAAWLILLTVTARGGAETAIDPTWAKALQVFTANQGWTPGLMEILSVDLDKHGVEKGSERRVMQITVDDDNQLQTEVLSAEKDGEDITEKERKKQKRDSGRGGDGNDFFPSPFDPAIQEKIQWQRTEVTTYVDGKLCREYDVRMHWQKKRYYVGRALIEEDRGVPIRFVATIEPLPVFVKELEFHIEYNGDPEAWYVRSVGFQGRGTIVLIDKRFRTSLTFDDYFRYTAE